MDLEFFSKQKNRLTFLPSLKHPLWWEITMNNRPSKYLDESHGMLGKINAIEKTE